MERRRKGWGRGMKEWEKEEMGGKKGMVRRKGWCGGRNGEGGEGMVREGKEW